MNKAYPSNLTLEQFELLRPLIPPAKPGGRPRSVEMWDILNAIFACSVRGLPLAVAATRLSQLANGVHLFPQLAH